MTLGILAAMEQEIGLVTEMVENPVHTQLGSRDFVSGKINGIDCVAVFSKWGKVAATITATLLIEHFKIDRLVFIGTAGALANELNVGDIVVARRLVQHDLDARPIIPRFQIPLTNKVYIDSDRQLSSLAIQSIKPLIQKEFKEIVGAKVWEEFSFVKPVLTEGDIASGDQFINSDEKRQELISLLPEVLCVEMEGAAVAQVCNEFNLPFTVIRIISDKANHDARIDFSRFIEEVANIYSKEIIVALTKSLGNEQ
ncbi:MAG: 5'-methylthioadenosine/adenosylhomocysteine nucleosidase [Bacteroidales bacterium]|nr:5'-methylthioadenosine/adenosylhomocysteine nucleosidase [Bacteroidales bacterium]